jgi:hypothetical protein
VMIDADHLKSRIHRGDGARPTGSYRIVFVDGFPNLQTPDLVGLNRTCRVMARTISEFSSTPKHHIGKPWGLDRSDK